MKTFDQLTPEQQTEAIKRTTTDLLEAICEGAIRFDDNLNKDDLQKRIDAAAKKADAMQTPWFVGAYIMDTCRKDIEDMARGTAEDALYAEENEHVIRGIA